MGEIIEISIIMWIVAVASFAPLGYFIYLFMVSGGESFGKSDPSDHTVENTKYYKLINDTLNTLLGGSTAKPASETASQEQTAPVPQQPTTQRRTATPATTATASSNTATQTTTTTKRRKPSTAAKTPAKKKTTATKRRTATKKAAPKT